MECDLEQIDNLRLNKLTQSFSALAKTRMDGTSFIYEPLGVFMVDSSELRKLSNDNDCVDDYRQIAQKFNWSKKFSNQSNVRILDVGCGTGRWLYAFSNYVKPQLPNLEISYDLLDPSEHAMLRAITRIEHPLKTGH